MVERLPFMSVEVAEYQILTKGLSLSHKGLISELLTAMWNEGGYLPLDTVELSKLLGVERRRLEQTLPKLIGRFTLNGDYFTVDFLLKARQRAEKSRQKNSENGRRGGLISAEKRRKQRVSEVNPPSGASSNHNQSHIHNSSLLKEERNGFDQDLLRFCEAFQVANADRQAIPEEIIDAWQSAIKRADPELIIAQAKLYSQTKKAKDSVYCIGAKNWLLKSKWDIDYQRIIKLEQSHAAKQSLSNGTRGGSLDAIIHDTLDRHVGPDSGTSTPRSENDNDPGIIDHDPDE